MCNYKKLAFTEHGFVIECNSCGNYQIAFGTLNANLSPKEFIEFVKSTIRKEINKVTNCPPKSIYLEIPSSNCKFILDENEFSLLKKLLSKALFSIDIERMLMENNLN